MALQDNGYEVFVICPQGKKLWLIDHPEERKIMGIFGRKRVEEKLAWKYSIPGLLAAYRRVFEKNN